MSTRVSRSGVEELPAPPDVLGGAVLAVLGLLHLFVIQLGGPVGWLVLLVGWPLVGGTVAARLSTAANARVSSVLAGTFGGIATTVILLLTGVFGAWPAFVTEQLGVSLWPVTFAAFVLFAVSWPVFSFAGGVLSERF